MVTFVVFGERGMLGAVVARRWQELGGIPSAGAEPPDYVVNCVRPDLPVWSEHLAEQARLIQPSTDAIAEDTEYARTKRIIERTPGAVIIRTGIVDVTRQPGVAYRNWRCNPLTPLEWADLAWRVKDRPGLHTAGREVVSRHQVASLVAYLWDTPQPVPAWSEVPLSRIVDNEGAEWPPLMDALMEYKEWEVAWRHAQS